MNQQFFSVEQDSVSFDPLPSLSQDILSDDFYVELPMMRDYKEDDENYLFQSCTDDIERNEEI